MDNKFDKLQGFIHNMKFKRQGISNLYLFETVDRNGNVTDTKYGMNLMTNVGFDDIFIQNKTFALSNTVGVFVGTGTGEIYRTSYEMGDVAFQALKATNIDVNKDYEFPIMYNEGAQPNTGLITLICKFGSVRYEYNITNFNFDVPISEYGIGTAWNHLWTHSHVFDINGDRTYITKKENERLFITIYTCISLYEQILLNAWENQTYVALTTPAIMFQRFHVSNIGTYKRSTTCDRTSSGITKTIDDITVPGTVRSISLLKDFTLSDTYGTSESYLDGFYGTAPGLKIIDKQYLPVVETVQQTEHFELIGYQAADPLATNIPEDAINANIGKDITNQNDWNKNKYPQFTTMMNVGLKSFSYISGDWTNTIQFHNDDSFQYSDAGLQPFYATPIHYWSTISSRTQTAYLFLNIYPDNPILAINHGHDSIYAASKYWDVSTWIPITNFDSIPVQARTAKYWIASSDQLAIIPTRQYRGFELIDPATGDSGFQTITQFESINVAHPSVDNVQYKWLAIGGQMYTMERKRRFQFDDSGYAVRLFTYGRWLVCLSANNTTSTTIRCIDTTTVNDSNVDPAIFNTTKNLDFTDSINAFTQVYTTETGTGWLCFQSVKSNTFQCVIWDLRAGTVGSTAYADWRFSAAIYGTNYVAYQKNGESTIHIYDLNNGYDVGNPIAIPSGNVVAMCGVDHVIWFSNNSQTYYVDIDSVDRTPMLCTSNAFNSIKRGTESACIVSSAVTSPGVLMMTQGQPSVSYETSKTLIFTTMNPSVVRDMSGFSNAAGTATYGKYFKIRYVGETLFCIYALSNENNSTLRNYYLFDLGRYLKSNVADGFVKLSYTGQYCAYLYGNYIIKNMNKMFPIANAIPFKLTGDTKTINSTNVLKHLRDKTYVLGYTNDPLWGNDEPGSYSNGMPPGKPKPITNQDGEIISWDYSS